MPSKLSKTLHLTAAMHIPPLPHHAPRHRSGKCVEPDAGGVTYVLAGNAGAGFTNGFPRHANGTYDFPSWVENGAQFVNGYMRVAVSSTGMRVEAVASDDGRVFDSVVIPPPALVGSHAAADGSDDANSNGGKGSGGRGAVWRDAAHSSGDAHAASGHPVTPSLMQRLAAAVVGWLS